jgi:hypothetical protein
MGSDRSLPQTGPIAAPICRKKDRQAYPLYPTVYWFRWCAFQKRPPEIPSTDPATDKGISTALPILVVIQ